MDKIKCLAVRPKESMEIVRKCLDENKISYSFDNELNWIFANLGDIPPKLYEVADVIDPVKTDGEKWWCEFEPIKGQVDVSNPLDSEDRARRCFVNYISWSGEFVNNASVNP